MHKYEKICQLATHYPAQDQFHAGKTHKHSYSTWRSGDRCECSVFPDHLTDPALSAVNYEKILMCISTFVKGYSSCFHSAFVISVKLT